MKIETVTPALFERILPLIADYQRFYGAQPDEERNRRFFGQFVDDHRNGIQFLALDEAGMAVGFATLFFSYSSIWASVTCLMNDLFVVPEARGRGVGRALIAHCLSYAVKSGFGRMRWHTFATNEVAQKLYNNTGASQIATYMYLLDVNTNQKIDEQTSKQDG